MGSLRVAGHSVNRYMVSTFTYYPFRDYREVHSDLSLSQLNSVYLTLRHTLSSRYIFTYFTQPHLHNTQYMNPEIFRTLILNRLFSKLLLLHERYLSLPQFILIYHSFHKFITVQSFGYTVGDSILARSSSKVGDSIFESSSSTLVGDSIFESFGSIFVGDPIFESSG